MGPTGELCYDDSSIKIEVVNLVITERTKDLGAVDVDGDGVIGGVIGEVAVAGNSGAGETCVETV